MRCVICDHLPTFSSDLVNGRCYRCLPVDDITIMASYEEMCEEEVREAFEPYLYNDKEHSM